MLAESAAAKGVFTYDVRIHPAAYSGAPSGSVQVGKIDNTKTYTVRVTLGGVPQPPVNGGPGDIARYVSAPTIAPGDTITMEQPTGVTQETFTVPGVAMSASAGSPTLTGNAPDAGVSVAFYESLCGLNTDDSFQVNPQGGAFSVIYPKPMNPGDLIQLVHFPGQGDKVAFESRVPGETPCLEADSLAFPSYPGNAPDPTPFSIYAGALLPSVTTGARLVLRRGGAILVDYSDPAATTYINKNTDVQPLPGDTIELYRPHTAGAPSMALMIPSVRTTYDTSNSLVAVDAPPAAWIRFRVASAFDMWQNARAAINTPGGRTVFNFAVSDGVDQAISLAGRDIYTTDWSSADARLQYTFGASPGDLAAPVLRLKLASKYKLAKLRSSLTASLTSSEVATTSFKLTLPAKFKTSASTKPAPRTLATAKRTVGAGTTKVRLKFSKSAKKLLTKLRKGKYPAQKATLTVTATDLSGNATTTVKTTKLVRK